MRLQTSICFLLLLGFLNFKLYGSEVLCIGIAGGTASGKTTLSKNLASLFPNDVVVIPCDNYYKDFSCLSSKEQEEFNFDHPDALNLDLLKKHLVDLKNEKSIEMPAAPSQNPKIPTKPPQHLSSKKIIIVEGILLFAVSQIRELLDYKIFVETADDLRLLRRIERTVNRGGSLESIKNQYLKTVRPMHELLIAPSKQFADIIVSGDGTDPSFLQQIVSKINTHLTKYSPSPLPPDFSERGSGYKINLDP